MKKIVRSINQLLRYSRIQVRLSVFFVLLLSISLAATSFVSYKQSSRAIQSKIELYSVQVMNQVSQNLRLEMNHFESAMDDIVSKEDLQNDLINYKKTPEMQYGITDKIRKLFRHQISLEGYITSESIFLDKDHILGVGAEFLDANQRDHLIEVSQKNFDYNYSYVNSTTGAPSIAISKQIKSSVSGIALGIIILTLSEEHVSNIYRQIDIGKSADLFIIDSTGMIISSRDKDINQVNQNYSDTQFVNDLKSYGKQQQSTFAYSVRGTDSLVAYSLIPNTDWYVVAAIPTSYLHAELIQLAKTIVWISLVCLSISAILAYIISLGISVPSKKIVFAMEEAQKGNLTLSIDDNNKDEMGKISQNFNEMIANIRLLIQETSISSQNVIVQAQMIDATSERTRQSSQQIATIIEQIAKGAVDQAQEAYECSTNMRDLSNKINIVGEGMDTVSQAVENTKRISENTQEMVILLNAKTDTAYSVSQEIIHGIKDFKEDLNNMRNIVGVISKIAGQTNILSINASIEAARAGIAGKGFAVVAQEVKAFAEQTKSASLLISDMISDVQNKYEITANLANRASVIIEDQRETAKETNLSFKTIFNTMEQISSDIFHMNDAVKEILLSKEKTLEAIDIISSVTEETAATTEEATASTEEQLSSAEELAALAENLTQNAHGLSISISKFNITKGDDRRDERD
ncbi:MAG: methyl-accepting chemotaxis protein [Candidatus Pristimantibacillus sp.]